MHLFDNVLKHIDTPPFQLRSGEHRRIPIQVGAQCTGGCGGAPLHKLRLFYRPPTAPVDEHLREVRGLGVAFLEEPSKERLGRIAPSEGVGARRSDRWQSPARTTRSRPCVCHRRALQKPFELMRPHPTELLFIAGDAL